MKKFSEAVRCILSGLIGLLRLFSSLDCPKSDQTASLAKFCGLEKLSRPKRIKFTHLSGAVKSCFFFAIFSQRITISKNLRDAFKNVLADFVR